MSKRGALWYDLSSVAKHDGAASGVQRVAAGLAIGLTETPATPAIRFCRFDKKRGFAALSDADAARTLERIALGLARADAPRSLVDRVRRQRRTPLAGPFAPGDVLFNPGFVTYKREQQHEVSALLARMQVSYVGYVYDLVPVLFPEWWRLDQQSRYRDWLCWTGESAALVLSCSDSTRRDALRFFSDEKIRAASVETMRLGDELPRGLRAARSADEQRGAAPPPFVLYVSTLEVRKNHRLLFHVWRRLLAAHGRERIPDLVLVGKRGWLVDDFLTELEQSRFLDGKIAWRERVEDDELARLYAGCLFTVYPSFYEGWGLPVAESLAFGKTAVVSSASSLPEVGCDFVDYHDPHDVAGATARIERAIFDAAHREGRERAIRERFRARTWQQSAADLLARIEPLFAEPPAQRAI